MTDHTLPDLPPLPADHPIGGQPEAVQADLDWLITDSITNHPRSLQASIGPSEIGHPCDRRIAYKLGSHPEVNTARTVAWRPTIGTYGHEGLEHRIADWQAGQVYDRYYLEERVQVGTIGGHPVTGCADLYDRYIATVLDWKFVGTTSLRNYRRSGPSQQYRTQAHLYGNGFAAAGLPVAHVAIYFLPTAGEWADRHFWSEPHDPAIGVAAMARAEAINTAVTALGDAAYPLMKTADAYCTSCPFFSPGSTDLAAGCPGDTGSARALTAIAPATLADALA